MPEMIESRPGYFRADIPFLPVPKGAVKVAVVAGWAHKYMPKNTRESIKALRVFFASYYRHPPMTGPVKVTVTYYKTRPKTGRVKTYGGIPFDPKRPDADNRTKTLHDSGTGILWIDDSQIVWEDKRKVLESREIGDHTFIEVEELKEDGKTNGSKS